MRGSSGGCRGGCRGVLSPNWLCGPTCGLEPSTDAMPPLAERGARGASDAFASRSQSSSQQLRDATAASDAMPTRPRSGDCCVFCSVLRRSRTRGVGSP